MSAGAGETVIVLERELAEEPDALGNAVEVWPDPEDGRPVHGVLVAPRDELEVREPARQAVPEGFQLLYRGGDAPPASTDRVVVRGQTYPVDGMPRVWDRGGPHGRRGWVAWVRTVEG